MNTFMSIIFIVIYLNYFQSSITVRMTVFVKRGSTVNFSCPFIAVTTPITWRGPPNLTIYSINKKVNRQIDKLNRIDVNGNSTPQQYNLSIFNFTKIDIGVYRCDTLINKHSMKHFIEVNIADPPTNMKIINETKEGLLIGQENLLLNLICTVDIGKPDTTLELKLDNTSIMSNSSEYVQHLFVARRFHHLKYLKCIAENTFYKLAKDVQIYVYLTPEVHVYSEPLANVEEGNDIILVCWYESNIEETVLRWKRNNVPVLNTQNTNLTLTNVSKEDTGTYSCSVENRIGVGTDMINITVLYKPRVMNLSNTFEIESNFGKPSFISFTVASGTKPYIAWTYDVGGKIGYWNVQDIGEEKYNVSSTIVPYDKSHLGHYAVRVRNTIGSVSLSIELVGFIVNVFPSELVCNMSNVIELTCNVSQYTTLNLSNMWVHSYDGTEIRSIEGSVNNRSSKLRIPFCDYRDAGTYTCMWMSTTLMHSYSSKVYVQSHPVLTLAKTFKQHWKTTLNVRFYSFPPPVEVLWFYKDKPISTTKLPVGKNVHETGVKLRIRTKRVIAKGYVTSHQINGTRSTFVELYSCQVRNIMGNLDVSFHELNSTRDITSNIGKAYGISHWLISVVIGSFLTVVVIIVTISLLFNRYFQGKTREPNGQNDFQREQEIGSRNSDQPSINHSYDEVDSAYYHTVEWRNYSVEESVTLNNDLTMNTDASIGSRDSVKTRDLTEQSQNDDEVNSYMELF